MLETSIVPMKRMREAVEDFAENLFQWKSPNGSSNCDVEKENGAQKGAQKEGSSEEGYVTPKRGKMASDHGDDVTVEKPATPKSRKSRSRFSGEGVPLFFTPKLNDVTAASTSGEAMTTPKNQTPVEGSLDAPRPRKVSRRSARLEFEQAEQEFRDRSSLWETPKHAHERESNKKVIEGSTPVRNGIDCYKESLEMKPVFEE